MRLPGKARAAIENGALAHFVTLNPDGSPQVAIVWVGLDGDDIVAAHLFDQQKLRNLRRDPRVAISFQLDTMDARGLTEYFVVHGIATISEGGAPDLLRELALVYMGPEVEFPGPGAPPGYITHVRVDRIHGAGF